MNIEQQRQAHRHKYTSRGYMCMRCVHRWVHVYAAKRKRQTTTVLFLFVKVFAKHLWKITREVMIKAYIAC